MKIERSSGILLHPTSLPGGDLGASARAFVDLLASAGQRWWQILPLNPTDFLGSPYSSPSSMASNVGLIDLSEFGEPALAVETGSDRIDVAAVKAAKSNVLRRAWQAFTGDPEYDRFCREQAHWLDDWALFQAAKDLHGGSHWADWPEELVRRDPEALHELAQRAADTIEFTRFGQWIFDRQWSELRTYAAERDIQIIGDVPIFVAMDSVDVWANRELFEVSEGGRATSVAGVPPDYFSATGQKWGNPLFRWDVLAESDFAWWKARIRRVREMVDLVRIDHFRGFESYWAVPADAPTAETGEWRKGPGDAFFDAIRDEFGVVPFIAEDLGLITDDVLRLRDRHSLPGMKVMQFAFDGGPDHPFLPHTYPESCVAYTGTHDNDTTQGWWDSLGEETRHRVRTYLSHGNDGIVWAMIESLHASDADLVVVPFQDLYELGTEARMNLPGTSGGNWSWRATPDLFDDREPWKRLERTVDLAGR